MSLKAITLHQPWASLITYGYKTIETRSWQTDYRGTLFIHAGKKWNRELRNLCLTKPFRSCLAEIGITDPDDLPRGYMLGKVYLERIITTSAIARYNLIKEVGSKYEEDFGDYSAGRYGWILTNIQRYIEPIPCNGAMGPWSYIEPYHTPEDRGGKPWIVNVPVIR